MSTVPPPPPKHHHTQPLHNFSLPFLQWGHRIHLNHHCRRRTSPLTATDSDDSDLNRNLNNRNKPNRHRNRNRNSPLGGENAAASPEKVTETATGAGAVKRNDADDGDVKPWKLRPRRLAIDAVDGNGAAVTVKPVRMMRGVEEENEKDNGKKRRLWISLSKEEIEEDVYAFTGSRPARRPKKRNQNRAETR